MLIDAKHKVLLVEQEHAPWVMPAIPHAKKYKEWLVVPHQQDETIILRNLGFSPPAPIERYYDWPGRFKPFDHQIKTAAFLTLSHRAFVLNDIGTGKTMAAYWAIDYLMSIGRVKKALIISPLSTLERVHGDAIFGNLTHRSFAILHGTREKRRKLLQHPFDFYIINHDGVGTCLAELKNFPGLDLILIDECAVLRNATTRRWKDTRGLISPSMIAWGLTGAPTPNEPTDAYAQVKLINPSCLTNFPSFRSFQLATMDQKGMHFPVWTPKQNAMNTVYSIMQPAIRFTRDECLDLPECLYETREVDLTPEQNKTYKALLKDMMADVQGGKVTALNAGVLLMRLVQVANGVVYSKDGEHLTMDCAPRLSALKEIIEEAGTKVIVYVPFIGSLNYLEKELSKHWTVATVSGSTGAHARSETFKSFQQDPDPHVLVAHPGCMSHGLNLQKASTIVWWAPVTSNEQYEQANGRINRPGQKNTMLVVNLTGSPVEKKIYARLERKQKLQGLLLDLIAEGG